MHSIATGVEFVRRLDHAQSSEMAIVRHEFGRWLDFVIGADSMCAAVLSATGEAVVNAFEHAYLDQAGPIEVHATMQRAYQRLTVLVRDHGRWRIPPAHLDAHGHGLALIDKLTADNAVHKSATGTTMSMLWHLEPQAY
ncbi:ATP-binding protein [Rhodococcus sp. F64268]|uniref:ATP-binding protein n=1 Tax=Rhodococcus sp. F64268 TaxID=2926402 RepID=UPI001FF2F9CE|nr:ATP-binding protein [Rhodococcus sp. F64268]MCK0090497.1 ATP-binding protein [Rhodococcus sp. F64268]